MNVKYLVYRTGTDGWAFQLKVAGRQVVPRSEVYRTLPGCLNGIASCREHSPFDRFYVREDVGSSNSFRIRASNNRTISSGNLYSTVEDREIAIKQVKKYAAAAPVEISTNEGKERNRK